MANYQHNGQHYSQYSTQFDEYGNPIIPQAHAGAGAEAGQYYATSHGMRQGTVSSRQNDELFFGQQQQQQQQPQYQAPPPPPPRPGTQYAYQQPAAQHQQYTPPTPSQQYNPSTFGRPLSVIANQTYNGAPIQSPATISPHAPYNPADYQQDGLQRFGSIRSSPGYSPAGYPVASPTLSGYSPAAQPTPTFAAPATLQQQSYGRTSLYGPPRPVVQNASYTSEQGAPPPPPRPAQYSLNVQPLSTIPGSATEAPEGWKNLPPQPTPPQPPHQFASSPPAQQPYGRSGSDGYLSSPHTHTHHRNSLSQSSRYPIEDHAEPPTASYPSPSQQRHPLPPTPTPPAPPPHSANRAHVAQPQPQDYFSGGNRRSQNSEDIARQEQMTAEELMNQVEQEVMGMTMASATANSPSIHVDSSYAQGHHRAFSYEPLPREGHNGSLSNGHLTPDARYEDFQGTESDLEADAGIEAMRLADEEEAAEEARRMSGSVPGHSRYGSHSSQQHHSYAQEHYSEGELSDGPPMDLSLIGGDFAGPPMTYAPPPDQLTVERQPSQSHSHASPSHPASSQGSMRRSDRSDMDSQTYYEQDDNIHPFPPFASNARVDTGGTGGLEEPSLGRRRLSYDEGDETGFVDDGQTFMQDMSFYPEVPERRPLPPPPANDSPSFSPGLTPYPQDSYNSMLYASPDSPWPQAPENYIPASANSTIPRSTSLLSQNTQPQALPMPRSRTDAEEREQRWRAQQQRMSRYMTDSASETPANASAVALDLPTLPSSKRYNPSKLGTKDYDKCTEPWALSGVVAWLKLMTEGEQDLRQSHLVEGLEKLFAAKVPTMNIAEAETLAAKVVAQMREEGVLIQEEEWYKFTQTSMTGVVYQLTGSGCYSPKLHVYSSPGRCYAHHCQRTLKKVDLSSQPSLKANDDWTSHYKFTKEALDRVENKKEIDRQQILFEIVQKEDKYLDDLEVLRVLYRDALQSAKPPLITPQRLPSFIRDVFGKADAVKKANEDHLLPQLKYRQKEQGPWVAGFSDIFREWIRKAKPAYIAYASAFPNANFRIRKEAEKNMLFRSFLDKARSNPLSGKLGWDTYLKVPITKLQQYGLLLDTVLRKSTVDNEERRNLQTAINEIREVTLECDAQVDLMSRKVNLKDLQNKLKLRPGMERVELNLDHLGRELLFKGDLQRVGANRFTWLETHALLFDHYLVLAKTDHDRDANGVKTEKYDVSRLPIPMDLLILESRDDNPVVKSKTGIASVTTVVPTGGNEAGNRLTRIASTQPSPGPGQLQHTNTSTSIQSSGSMPPSMQRTVTTTILEPAGGSKEDKTMFPFRIKHLGKEVYTLYAPSAQNREDWCDKILEAKTRHAASLFQQNAEPFKLRVMADCAFGYESNSQSAGKSIVIHGTPLDRAVREVEERYKDAGRPPVMCRARVNCATSFTQSDGKEMCAIGTDFGVYIATLNDPRGWNRVIPTSRVTQIAVLEEFSLFLLIADRSLIAYHLDVVCPAGGGPVNISASGTRGAPQKLSGSRDVGFFCTGRMKDRQLVFFKKRENLNSVFKVSLHFDFCIPRSCVGSLVFSLPTVVLSSPLLFATR